MIYPSNSSSARSSSPKPSESAEELALAEDAYACLTSPHVDVAPEHVGDMYPDCPPYVFPTLKRLEGMSYDERVRVRQQEPLKKRVRRQLKDYIHTHVLSMTLKGVSNGDQISLAFVST